MTVYIVRNLVNGLGYVGATTTSLRERWNTHLSEARTRGKSPFHLALNEFGRGAFEIKPLEEASNVEDMRRLEREWTVRLGTTNPLLGYNVSTGYKLNAETRAKMSRARTGLIPTSAHREAVSRGLKGKPKSAAHCAALSAARRKYVNAHKSA